jgi:glycosyltransferase involved in cell wall biosynthesis
VTQPPEASKRISVVIPCYNRERWIAEAITSALQGPEVEVIVVDDGSTDGSWDVIRSFGDRIRSSRIDNSGPSAARNVGARMATAPFIRFLDSDDRIPDGALAAQVEAASAAAPRQIVLGDACSIDEGGAIIQSRGYGFAGRVPPGPIPRSQLISQIVSTSLPIFPTDIWRRVGGYDEELNIAEDHELAVRLVASGHEFVRIPTIVWQVREHGDERLSRGLSASGYSRLLQSYERMAKTLLQASEPFSASEKASLGRLFWTGARDAARDGFDGPARALFELALRIGGRSAAQGSFAIRFLYRFMSPLAAEKIVMALKGLAARRSY